MGFFSRAFSTKSELERSIEEAQVTALQSIRGMNESEARGMARQMIKRAKDEAAQQGTTDLPSNFGEILLEREKTDETTRRRFAVKRKEGVRDEDILWWWNMPDLQRRLMIQDDDITSLAIFNQHMDEGKTKDEAAVAVRKSKLVCGDPEDTTHVSGDDRPLPFELKDRINIYIQKRSAEDPEAFKREVKAASTFNAVVRKEIRARRI